MAVTSFKFDILNLTLIMRENNDIFGFFSFLFNYWLETLAKSPSHQRL